MPTLLKKCLAFVDPATRAQAVGLIVLMILGALLEVVGIGLVFPLVKVISEPGLLSQYTWAKPFLGQITPENQPTVLIFLAAGFLGVIVFKNAFLLMVYFVQGRFFAKNEALFAHKLFAHYLRGDYRLHLTRNSAALINNVTSTVSAVYSHTLRGFMTIAIEIFLIAILALVLLAADPQMTIGALVMVSFAIAIFYVGIKKRLNTWGRQMTVTRAQIIKILQQGFHSIKEVKVLGREDFILDDFNVHREKYANTEAKIFVASNAPRLWIETVVITCAMLGVIYIVNRGGQMSGLFSLLALFAAAAFRLIPSMNRILMAMNSIKSGAYPVNILYEDLQDFQPAFQRPDGYNGEKLPFNETLVLDDVSFTYPETDVAAVSKISLTIEKGQSIGFVGPSGGGKTTLVDIVLGLLPPESGKILIDGTDVSGNMPAWQANLSYVPQSVYLIDETLRRNIAFGIRDEDISEDQLANAIRLAQLEDLVSDLPDGLETNVGEQGTRLSGGQQQRVGIARALYQDPEILVLDEATSSLDSETEHEINKAIEQLGHEKTVIVIAHRLSTVRKCDRLVFLDGGSVVDTGTFDELTASNDAFRNLVELAAL